MPIDVQALVIWLIIGAIAGWLAGQIMAGGGFGLVGNIIVGIVGAVVAGWLFPTLGFSVGGPFVGAIINALIGAIIVLFVIVLLRRAACCDGNRGAALTCGRAARSPLKRPSRWHYLLRSGPRSKNTIVTGEPNPTLSMPRTRPTRPNGSVTFDRIVVPSRPMMPANVPHRPPRRATGPGLLLLPASMDIKEQETESRSLNLAGSKPRGLVRRCRGGLSPMGIPLFPDAVGLTPPAMLGLLGLWLGFRRWSASWPMRWLLPLFAASAVALLASLHLIAHRQLTDLVHLSGLVASTAIAAIAFLATLIGLSMFMGNLKHRLAVWTAGRRIGWAERVFGGLAGAAFGTLL